MYRFGARSLDPPAFITLAGGGDLPGARWVDEAEKVANIRRGDYRTVVPDIETISFA